MNQYLRNLLIITVLGLITMIILLTATYFSGHKSFTKLAKEHLTAIRTSKKIQIETYFSQIRNQCETLAQDFMIIQAMKDFKDAFSRLEEISINENITSQKAALKQYYNEQFLMRLNPNLNVKKTAQEFFPSKPASILLQYAYIVKNPNPTGQKDKLDSAPSAGPYDVIHKKYHPYMRNFLEKFKYYDGFLIDHVTGIVLYSVFKEIDFTNNLYTTELKNSNLSHLTEKISRSEKTHEAKIVDYKFYAPSYAAPAAFIAAPIFDGDEQIGALAFQMPIDQINMYMTDNKEWEEAGFGQTGEAYLVGKDYLMRSVSRFLIQEPERYFQFLEQEKVDPLVIKNIEIFNTSILLQKINTKPTRAGLRGKTGSMKAKDYRGLEVLSAYAPLDIKGLDWAILSEKDINESLTPLRRLILTISLWSMLILVVLILLSFFFTWLSPDQKAKKIKKAKVK